MLTEQEIAERCRAADNALASQRLEGVEPNERIIAEAQGFIVGELEIADLLEAYIAAVRRDPTSKVCNLPL